MASPEPSLPLAHALVLGALHGPAELLPISSSGHTELVPWLLGWEYAELDGEVRKAFEIALHAGTAAALLIALRGEVADALRDLDRRGVVLVVGSLVPPAVAGLAFERVIEDRLAAPGSIAAGLAAGGVALWAADRVAAVRGSARSYNSAGAGDALALGVAQALALVPGLSRNGMTLAAARIRGFARPDAVALSWQVALPVIGAATGLKAAQLVRRGLPRRLRGAFAAGVGASFASTLASAAAIRRLERDRSPAPLALYRLALAGVVIRALRDDGRR